jgi:signal transduction histidine kinase/ActR/RegA family two-component response regulator
MQKIAAKEVQANNIFNRALAFSLICGFIAAILNYYPIFLFSELTLIFGPALSLLVALSLGPWWGALTAAVASTTLIYSWGHYYGFLVFIPEAFIVGTLYRKGWNELVAVLFYWALVAIPFLIQLIFIDSKTDLALDLTAKYFVNSFLYTLIASALLWFFSVPSWLNIYPVRSYKLRTQIFTILMVSMAIPIVTISLFNEQKAQQQIITNIKSRLQNGTQRITQGLDRYLKENRLVIENRAALLALNSANILSSSEKLKQFHLKHPEFISMLIASKKGELTAFSSSDTADASVSEKIIIDQSIADRDYFQNALKGSSYTSQAFKGRAKGDPIVTISTPIIASNSADIIGVLAGSLNLYQLEMLLEGRGFGRGRGRYQRSVQLYLVLDSENKVIFASEGIQAELLQTVKWTLKKSTEHSGFFETSLYAGAVLTGEAISDNGWQVYSLYPEAEFNRLSRNNYHQFAMMLSVVILLVSLLAIFLSYQINRPLQWLFKRIVDFNVKSETDERVSISPLVPMEMVSLIRAHESAEKRLRHAFQTERLHQQKRLHAEKANEAKSTFLSAMSHELRTPLNAISGFSQLLVLDKSLNKESKEFVNEIEIASQHLMLLVNDILDMSKIESDKLKLNIEAFDIGVLLEQTMPLLENQAKARNVNIILKPSDRKLIVVADQLRLKQVMINLLSNAIKYNHNGGQVIISLHIDDPKKCTIRVTDTGVGIAPEKLNELFEIFNRLDKENSDVDGYGIGLVISKKLLELMNGAIKVESELEKGTCFCVCLPTQDSTDKNTIKTPSDQQTTKNNQIMPCRILYVEDNDVNALVMNRAMKRYSNIEIVRESNGELGLQRLTNEFFDFVLLDISLPDMSGLDILQIMQKDLTQQYSQVFAVSANAMSEDIDKGLAAGFDEYVTKPVKFDLLFDLIAKHQNQSQVH